MPDESYEVPGKIMFYGFKLNHFGSQYRQNDNNSLDEITEAEETHLWLNPLKHAMFLMLNNRINRSDIER